MAQSLVHRQGVDVARFVAAFGVVVAHAEASPRDWVGHLALALFAILTAFLAVKSAERAGGSYAYLPRARRLILPWVVWSVFYLAVETLISDNPDPFHLLRDPWMLLYGGYIHLWFLPFIGLAMVLVGPVVSWVGSPQRLALAALALVALSVPLFWAHEVLHLPEPLPQWAFTLPCYGLGLLLARAQTVDRSGGLLLAGLALSGVAVWMGQAAPWTFTILGGLVAFEISWRLPIRGNWAPHLGQVAFGIYLIHPFLMLVIYKFAGPDVPVLTGAFLDFLLAWAVVAVLRQLPVFARIT